MKVSVAVDDERDPVGSVRSDYDQKRTRLYLNVMSSEHCSVESESNTTAERNSKPEGKSVRGFVQIRTNNFKNGDCGAGSPTSDLILTPSSFCRIIR